MVKIYKNKALRSIVFALIPGLSFAGKPSTTSSPPSSGSTTSQTPGSTTTPGTSSGTPGGVTQADIANIVDQALKKHEQDKRTNNIDPNIKMALEAILGPTAAAAVITLVSVPLKSYYEEYSKRTRFSIWDRFPLNLVMPKQSSPLLSADLEGFNNRQAQIKGQKPGEKPGEKYGQLVENYHNLLKDSKSQIHGNEELLTAGNKKIKYLDVSNLPLLTGRTDSKDIFRTAADKLLQLNKRFETDGALASRTPEQLAYHNGEFHAVSILHLTQGVLKSGNLGQAEKLARDIVQAREFHRQQLRRQGLSAAEGKYHTDRINQYATLLTNVSASLADKQHHDAQIRFLETAESGLEKTNYTYLTERIYGVSESAAETHERMELKSALGTTLGEAQENYKTASPAKYADSIQERLSKITADSEEKPLRQEDRVYQAKKMAADLVKKHKMTTKDSKTALTNFKKEFDTIKENLANHPHEQAAFHDYIIAAAQKAPDLFKDQPVLGNTAGPAHEHEQFIAEMTLDRDQARDKAKFEDLKADAASLHHFATPNNLDYLATQAREIAQTVSEKIQYHTSQIDQSNKSEEESEDQKKRDHHVKMQKKYKQVLSAISKKLNEDGHLLPALELHHQSIAILQPGYGTQIKEKIWSGATQEERDETIKKHKNAMADLLKRKQEAQNPMKTEKQEEVSHDSSSKPSSGSSEIMVESFESSKPSTTHDHPRASPPTATEKRIQEIIKHHGLTDHRPTHGAKIEPSKT